MISRIRSRGYLVISLAACCLVVIVGAVWFSWAHGVRPRPNILLITLDTTRWDYLSCYGHKEKITPNIDKLAEEGIQYLHAVSPASWTLPSHASIFTGMLPTHHNAHFGIDKNAKQGDAEGFTIYTLHPMLPTLAEELRKAGYYTRGIIAGATLNSSFGVSRGFDDYDDRLPAVGGMNERRADVVTSLALGWLKSYSLDPNAKPFFLFLNYFDPHNPYRAPAPWGDQTVPEELYNLRSPRYVSVFRGDRDLTDEERGVLLKQYSDEIRFMDSQIGRLFNEMKQAGVYDSTLIVVVSDHGESFGEHRLLEHGRALYEDLIRVPLIVKYPLKDRKRGVVDRRVSIMGIMATILEYVGLPVPKTVDSGTLSDKKQALISEVHRDSVWINRYGERFDKDEKAIYEGDYKWIWNSDGKHELYDLLNDPQEKNNLIGKMPELERRLQARLVPLIEESNRLASLSVPQLDQELRGRLKALGYLQ